MNEIVIQTEAITKTYVSGTNEVHAVRGIDLTVRQGEFVAIMGASGSGKSTLMNLLGCLDSPTSGAYLLDGVRVDGLAKNGVRCTNGFGRKSLRTGVTVMTSSWRAGARRRTRCAPDRTPTPSSPHSGACARSASRRMPCTGPARPGRPAR